MDDNNGITMSELTEEFDISSRTLRFYEEKGLISPRRTQGNQRRYCDNDRKRLKWILRGKRFGYSLNEISKMLGMTETTIGEANRIKTTLAFGEEKLRDLEDRIEELKIMRTEMLTLKENLLKRLTELETS